MGTQASCEAWEAEKKVIGVAKEDIMGNDGQNREELDSPSGKENEEGGQLDTLAKNRVVEIEDEKELIEILRELQQDSDEIAADLIESSESDIPEDRGANILTSVLDKYRDEVGIKNPPLSVEPENYGVMNIAGTIEEIGEVEYWISKKAGIKSRLQSSLLKRVANIKSWWARLKSEYRKMDLYELVREQTGRIRVLNSLLDETKKRANLSRKDIYDRHRNLLKDAKEAAVDLRRVERHVDNLAEIKRNSDKIFAKIDPTTEEGFEIQQLVLDLREKAERIREFRDDCVRTINWLRETEGSYKTFEDIMDGYMRMISNIRGRTANLLVYIDDFNNIAAGIKEGKDMTNELYQGIVSLSEGVFASVGEIQKGIKEISEHCGTLEDLELPRYINKCLSGPISDINRAEKRLGRSRFLAEIAKSYAKE